MVTPSPRSRTAPGIRLTAMPGFSSSGVEAGLGQDGAVGGAQVGGDRGAVVGAGAGADLEVGRGDLLVGARHRHHVGLVVRGEAAGLGGAADQRVRSTATTSPVEKTSEATGPGDAGRGRLAGDAGLLRRELVGVGAPARVMPSWSVVGGAGADGIGGGGRRRAPATGGRGDVRRPAGWRRCPRRPRRRSARRPVGTVRGSGSGSGVLAAGDRGSGCRARAPGRTAARRPGRPGPGRW